MNNISIIIGMGLVTYIPRFLPFVLMKKQNINKDFGRFLKLIPYTALGALIIPGVFTAIEGHLSANITGMVVAIILAYLTENLLITVVLAIASSYIILLL